MIVSIDSSSTIAAITLPAVTVSSVATPIEWEVSMLFKKTVIKNLDQTDQYLVRWSLRLPFGWSAKIHHILLPDHDRCSHDHPWNFVRVIIWGGYIEECGNCAKTVLAHRKPWRPWAPWRIYWCGPHFRHRITYLPNGHSYSLVFVGPKFRNWGFFTKDGWIEFKKFLSSLGDRVNWCE